MRELRIDNQHQRPSPILERGSPAGEQLAHARPQPEQQQDQVLLKIGFQNIQGIAGKEEYIEWLMHNHHFDVLCLVETWMTPGANHRFRPTTIADVRQPISETGRQGQGGILIIGRTIAVKDQVRLSATDIAKRHCTLAIGSTRLVVCYHAPRPEIDAELFTMLEHLHATADQYAQTIVAGDVNAKHPALGSTGTNPRGNALKALVDESRWSAELPMEGRFTTQNQQPDQVLVLGDPVVRFVVMNDVATTSDHQPMHFSIPSPLVDIEKEYTRLEISKLREDSTRKEYYSRMISEHPAWKRRLERLREPAPDAPYEERQCYIDAAYTEVTATIIRIVTDVVGVKRISRVHARRNFKTAEMLGLEQTILDMQLLAERGSVAAKQMVKRHLGNTRKQLRLLIKQRQREVFDQAATAMDQGAIHVFQKMVSCMKGRTMRTGCQLDPDRMDEYSDHFQSTFGGAPGGNRATNAELLEASDPRHASIDAQPFTLGHELVDEVVRKLSNGKAAGKDGMM